MHSRQCSQCPNRFEDRGAGSGIKRDLCSVECETAQKRSKAQASSERSNLRKVANRTGGTVDPLAGVYGRYSFPIPYGYDPHHWCQRNWLRDHVRSLDLPRDEAVEMFRDLLSDERNISVLKHEVHWDGHYSANNLFTREDVKPEAFVFADELGAAMRQKLERAYPSRVTGCICRAPLDGRPHDAECLARFGLERSGSEVYAAIGGLTHACRVCGKPCTVVETSFEQRPTPSATARESVGGRACRCGHPRSWHNDTNTECAQAGCKCKQEVSK